jgi:formylmethanofuran dehydrogenase subunit E
VSGKEKCQISVIGIFRPGLVGIDTYTSKSIDPFQLAESIGIKENHPVKAKITIEVVEGPCEQCGDPATGHQTCNKCGKLVCDKCAKTNAGRRYCQKCFAQIQSLSKLI